MSAGDTPELADRLAGHGREILLERLRSAFARQAASEGSAVDLDPVALEQLVQDAAARAGGALWLRSLAQAAVDELGIDLAEAIHHPAVARARELTGAPVYLTAPAPEAVPETAAEPEPADTRPQPNSGRGRTRARGRTPGARAGGRTARRSRDPHPGARPAALRAAGAAPGRRPRQRDRDPAPGRSRPRAAALRRRPRRAQALQRGGHRPPGVDGDREHPGRRRPSAACALAAGDAELHVTTGRGQAQFELPGLTDEELHEHLEPALERLHGGTAGVSGG